MIKRSQILRESVGWDQILLKLRRDLPTQSVLRQSHHISEHKPWAQRGLQLAFNGTHTHAKRGIQFPVKFPISNLQVRYKVSPICDECFDSTLSHTVKAECSMVPLLTRRGRAYPTRSHQTWNWSDHCMSSNNEQFKGIQTLLAFNFKD